MDTAKEKKSRVSKPKVRTGCATCKIRRVKCDEGKPFCTRCINFGADCEYIDDQSFKAPSSKPKLQRSRPPRFPKPPQSLKPIRPLRVAEAETTQTLRPQLNFLPIHQVTGSAEDAWYFNYYRDNTAIELSGGCKEHAWNRIFQQSSHFEPAVCQMTIAIAALHLSRHVEFLDNRASTESLAMHRQYAYRQYSKSLRSVHAILEAGIDWESRRTILLIAILIFSFESMEGKQESAIRQFHSTLALIKNRFGAQGLKRCLKGKSSSSITEDELITVVSNLIWMLVPSFECYFKSESYTSLSEDQLVAATARLDGVPFSADLPPDPKWNKQVEEYVVDMVYDHNGEDNYIHRAFRSVEEAKRVTERIFFKATSSRLRATMPTGEDEDCTPVIDANLLESGKNECHEAMVAWDAAFQPILNGCPEEYMAAATLKIQHLCMEVTLYTTWITLGGRYPRQQLHPHPLEVQRFVAACLSTILALCRQAMTEPNFSRGFTFDPGFIPGLMIVFFVASDMGSKMEALDLLQQMRPRREGKWDSSAGVEIVRKVLARRKL